jgi:hypothetical protein
MIKEPIFFAPFLKKPAAGQAFCFVFLFPVKKPAPQIGTSFSSRLGALHVDRVRTFGRILHVKGHLVAFVQFRERDADQGIAVKEQVFFLAFDSDESKSLFGFFLDNTVHLDFKLKIRRKFKYV